MKLSNTELDLLWDSVKAYAYNESKKWKNYADDYIQFAALNMCVEISKCPSQDKLKSYAMNAIRYAHSITAKKIINHRHRVGECGCDVDINDEMYQYAGEEIEPEIDDAEEVEKIRGAVCQIKHDKAREAAGYKMDGMSMRKIAKIMDVSHQRVQQLMVIARDELDIILGSYYCEFGS